MPKLKKKLGKAESSVRLEIHEQPQPHVKPHTPGLWFYAKTTNHKGGWLKGSTFVSLTIFAPIGLDCHLRKLA